MPELHTYPAKDLPDYLKWQILSFQRVEWPDGFEGENLNRDWIVRPESHPIHFTLEDNRLLISHAAVVWQTITHQEENYKSYGITGMFTYPSFRRQGYGLQLAKACKNYMLKSDADICMFFGVENGIYEKAGFTPMPDVRVKIGDKITNEIPYMLFISPKAKNDKAKFSQTPVCFGKNIDL